MSEKIKGMHHQVKENAYQYQSADYLHLNPAFQQNERLNKRKAPHGNWHTIIHIEHSGLKSSNMKKQTVRVS